MKSRILGILLASVVVVVVLVACSPPVTPEPTQVPAPAEPAVVEPTAVPTEAPAEGPTEEPKAEPTEAPAALPQKLILATTTSTYDSGLLDAILPSFEAEYNVQVEVIAVGTGQALQLGMDGNADVLLVHSRSREDGFMADGHGARREDVMYNDFVIVGPADDPAGISGSGEAARAFEAIAAAEAPFVSRGDDSGTHSKEKGIWAEAGIEPAGDWYIAAGQGMGAVLTMANEQQAYTLSDRATYLARTLEGLELEIMVEGDPILFNPYGVLAVDPGKNGEIKGDLANQFIDWLISMPTQELIGSYGADKFGAPLFTPDSEPWREAQGEAD
ncbi:MAG: substrate-binding domain-containing protein [Anaerolineae bacterium]|nr:substrate-binding domain-containing protein [Anaerolineae bacterium]